MRLLLDWHTLIRSVDDPSPNLRSPFVTLSSSSPESNWVRTPTRLQGHMVPAEILVLRMIAEMPSTSRTGQRHSSPSIDRVIWASAGGWSAGVRKTRKSGPSWATGNTWLLTYN